MKAGEHKIVPCLVCGENYRQSRSDQLYCSGMCSSRAWRMRHADWPRPAKCSFCGAEFQARNTKSRFCDRLCYLADERERKKIVGGPGKGWSGGKAFVDRKSCELCGEMFYAPPSGLKRGQHKFCSNSCRARNMAANPERFVKPYKRSRGGFRDDVGRYFRSSWEANWARYLNWLIEKQQIREWDYECRTFEFVKIKKGSRFYTPDFLVVNNDGSCEWHEVKGYMDQRSRTKIDRMRRYFPEEKLVLVDKTYYTKVAKDMKRIVQGWE